MQSLQYWLGGSSDNLENLLLNTVRAYVPDLKGVELEVAEPQLFLDTGIWHPCAPCEPSPQLCFSRGIHGAARPVSEPRHDGILLGAYNSC